MAIGKFLIETTPFAASENKLYQDIRQDLTVSLSIGHRSREEFRVTESDFAPWPPV